MKTRKGTPFAVAVVALIAALPVVAGAQVATSLINEGDALPAAGAGHVVTAVSNTAVNGVGGFAATLNSSDGVTTLSHAWGNATGGVGAILRTEPLFVGLSAAKLAFKGGTLVPSPDDIVPGLPLDGSGSLVLATGWPALPSGTSVFLQDWVVDPGAPVGASASNGLVGTTP